jgi:hypothetical protein
MLKIRTVLGEAFGTYFRSWGTLVARAFVVYLALSLAVMSVEKTAGPLWGAFMQLLVLVFGYTWLQALHFHESADAVRHDEGKHHIGPVLILRLLGASFLFTALFSVGLVLFVIPGLLIGTWLSMLVPAVVLERRGVFASLRRSRRLVKGHGRKVFAIYTTAFLIVMPLTIVLYVIVALLFQSNPELARFLNDIVVEPVTAPLLILVVTSMYLKLTGLEAEAATAPPSALPALA